jgi:hypothetical protein
MSVTVGSSLTTRQARFVEEYLVDGNGTQAAIRAGYSASGAYTEASRLLRNAEVARAIKTRQEADSERLRVSRERVVGMLLAAYDQARFHAEPAAMVSAARELGRLMGFYAPAKVAVDATAFVESGQFGAMSDQELFKLLATQQ